jgi:KaiC/GvpD/RAD55 family RecA-like ATPase
MLKNMFTIPVPDKTDDDEIMEIVKPGGFAAIFARAGVGKTALLVQIAVNGILRGKNVLHISTDDPVDKVDLWYKEVFQRLDHEHESLNIKKRKDQLLRHRFIMTFETESFSIAKLKKRVNELISQEIFVPTQIMIDDFSFEKVSSEELADLKEFVQANNLVFWFTIRTHRDEPVSEIKIPTRLMPMIGWFDFMIRLDPENDRIHVRPVTSDPSAADENGKDLFLDPSTLLIREMEK